MKKILALVLSMAMMLSTISFTVSADEISKWDGQSYSLEWLKDGDPEKTEGDEYYLNSAEDLAGLAYYVNNYASTNNIFTGDKVYLTVDVDLAGYDWTPIGPGEPREKNRFYGSFYGQGHTIYNLNVPANYFYAGLFGKVPTWSYTQVFDGITICNATVASKDAADDTVQKNKEGAGALIGGATGATVTNCHVTGTIGISGESKVGGLVGDSYAKISNCSVKATGTITATGEAAGGLVGQQITTSGQAASVENCSVIGDGGLSINSKLSSVGGAIGNVALETVTETTIDGVTVMNVSVNAEAAGELGGVASVASGYPATNSVVANVSTTLGNENVAAEDSKSVGAVVAELDGIYYATLKEALAAADDGDTVTLLDDVTVAAGETIVLDNVTLTSVDGITVTNNGLIQVKGESSLTIPTVTGETIDFMDGAIIKDSSIGGSVFVAGNVTFRGSNTFAMIYDFGTLTAYYGTTANMEWTVEAGGSVTLTNTARYGLGYGDNVTINGNLTDALTARATLTADDASLFMHGLVGQESSGWNCSSSFTANDAYIIIGSNNSFGNKPGNYGGTYTFNINNSVVDASRITFYEALSTTEFNITDSDVKMGTFMTRDADSVFTLTNSKVVSTTVTNGNDEGNYQAGTLNLVNSELTYSAPVTNTGTITLDLNSKLTAPSISGAGDINIDASSYTGYGELKLSDLIVADLTGFTGEVKLVNSDLISGGIDGNGNFTYEAAPVGGPIVGYTSSDRIWGDTRANAKNSLVVKIYSDETFMGETSLKPSTGYIDGDVEVTWNINLNPAASTTTSWEMSWAVAPSNTCQPTRVELVVDGKVVSEGAIQLNGPDNLDKIYAAIAGADGKFLSYETSLESAFNKVKDGETIYLLRDVELSNSISFTKDMAITLDGNGHTVKPAKNAKEGNSAFNFGQGNDGTRATRKYDIKNVVFTGWETDHVVRLQGTTSNITNCTFKNNNQPDGLGLLTITFADVTVDGCVFENNTCVKAIDVNSWGDHSASSSVIKNCVFNNNTVSGPGVIYYNDGAGLTVKDSEFVSNTVNTTDNAATLYMGFNSGINVTGNLFKDNTVTTSGSSMRIGGAIFAGFSGAGTITGNAFDGNVATGNGVSMPSGVAYSAHYGAGNLDGNYWGGGEPVLGVDFTHEYPTTNDLTVEEYYAEYSLDANGNLVLSDPKPIVSKVVAVQYVENATESNPDTGLKVYDIVIVAKDEHLINRLNTADLTFALNSDKVAYEIVPAEDITLTHNTDYPNRYMFNFDGKNNVADTDVAITIGRVRFTGYDAFVFNVADATTNLVTATTVDDNIVTYYSADGLAVNTDIDGDGDYLGVIDTVIPVPTRTLKITIDFPNAVVDNAASYQDMKVEITGNIDGVNKTVTYPLGGNMVGGSYVVTEDKLVLDNAYTVTVSGAGYRTARYTVTMTDDKELKFWNNVMDEEQVVEIGKDTSAVKVTYLAGDIVKDNKINIYDLSAVVSYFGTEELAAKYPQYAKYDLNRDNVIDSKDVAYVLVSWGK